MIFLDANIILRFILDDEPTLSPKAKRIIAKIERERIAVYISLLVFSEVIFTLERFYKLPKKKIMNRLLSIIKTPNVNIEKPRLLNEALSYYVTKNVSFIDAYQVALMGKKKIKEIYSFDRDFDKFPKVKRLES